MQRVLGFGVVGDEVPAIELMEQRFLIIDEDADIEVEMVTRLLAEPGIDGPAATDGPGRSKVDMSPATKANGSSGSVEGKMGNSTMRGAAAPDSKGTQLRDVEPGPCGEVTARESGSATAVAEARRAKGGSGHCHVGEPPGANGVRSAAAA